MTAFQNGSGIRNMREVDLNTRGTHSRPKITWLCVKGEIVKWQTIVSVILLVTTSLIIGLQEYGIIPSTTVGFICGDPLYSYKYKGEIITPEILGVTVALLPLLILLSSELFKSKTLRNADWFLILFYIREIFIGGFLTLLLTEVGKSIIAEHRPHFFDVCEPDTAKGCINGTWIEDYTCTSTKYPAYFITDSSRSFPSGHSSITAFIGVYCAYLVNVRFSTSQIGEFTKPFLVSVCLSYTILCSLTRITDKRHHWWDVLTGDFLGFFMALYYILMTHKKLQKIYGKEKDETVDLERTNCVV